MSRTAAYSPDEREVAALADRARALLADRSLPEVLAMLVLEHVGRADADQLIGAREAGIPRSTWRRLIASGELEGSLIGREYMARRGDVDAYRRANAVRVDTDARPAKLRAPANADDDFAALTAGAAE